MTDILRTIEIDATAGAVQVVLAEEFGCEPDVNQGRFTQVDGTAEWCARAIEALHRRGYKAWYK